MEDHNMINNKMMSVAPELLKELESYKIIPRESFSNCLGRILSEYKQMKLNEEIGTTQ